MIAVNQTRASRTLPLLVLSLLGAAALAGCSGGSGASGAAGNAGAAGPSGPPATGGGALATDISLAQTITATITSVTGGSTPTVSFYLVDQQGRGLTGLPPGSISFAIAYLTPGNNGTSSVWQSYINSVEQPSPTVGWGTTATRQATVETASTAGGVFVDNKDGTYTYKFAHDLGSYTAADATGPAVSYDGTLTHRIGLEIRGTTGTPTNNAVYTWQPARGATTGIYTRDIVSNHECDACHAKFSLHGGPRIDVAYCTICHNPGTSDAHSGNSLDLKVMVHKIHMGITLPTVVAAQSTAPAQGVGYTIWGYGNSVNNFNTVVFPQDQRNCTTCHQDTDAATPDADNYKSVPNMEACGACHDDVNFVTGQNHSAANLGGLSDADCVTCHGPQSTTGGGAWQVTAVHVVPELDQLANFQFQVVKVEPTTDAAGANLDATACPTGGAVCLVPPGDYLRVTIKIVNPATGATIALTDPGFSPTSFVPSPGNPALAASAPTVTVDLATTTANFTNPTNPQNTNAARSPPQTIKFLGYGSAVAGGALTYSAATATATSGTPPAANADGSYTRTSLFPMTTTINLIGINGNVAGAAFIEGRAVVNVAAPDQPAAYTTVGVTSAGPSYFPIALPAGQTQPAPRRLVVDMNNCNNCHKHLEHHGGARNSPANALLCASCHNPEMSTGSYPAATGQAIAGPMDLKFFIHSLHSGNYNYGGHNFTASAASPVPASPLVLDFDSLPVVFPGVLNDCEQCHIKGANTFYPVDPTQVFSTTVWGGAKKGPADDVAITPNVAACGACHTAASAQTHMQLNGGVIIDPSLTYATQPLIKNADGSTKAQYQMETCGICHGAGAIEDVKIVHGVGKF